MIGHLLLACPPSAVDADLLASICALESALETHDSLSDQVWAGDSMRLRLRASVRVGVRLRLGLWVWVWGCEWGCGCGGRGVSGGVGVGVGVWVTGEV